MQSFFLFLLVSQVLTRSYSQAMMPRETSHQIASEQTQIELRTAMTPIKYNRFKGIKKPVNLTRRMEPDVKIAGFLKFDPPSLDLRRFIFNDIPIAVSLNEPPKGPVSIYFEAPNMVFSECKLDFDPNNWNQKRTIKLTTTPYLTESTKARKINAKFCYNGKSNPQLHSSCQHYNVQRKKTKGYRCTAFGDPHYRTFSRQKFDFQGKGAFYLVKSKKLTIQQFNCPWNKVATVEGKVALRYYNTIVIFDAKTKTAQLASSTNNGVQITEVFGSHWRATMSDGSIVKVSYHSFPERPFLGTVITLGHIYSGKVNGLCGKIGMGKSPKGKAKAKGKILRQRWRVPECDNIFKLGPKASSVLANSDYSDEVTKNYCQVPNLDLPCGDGLMRERLEMVLSKLAPFQPMVEEKDLEQFAPKSDAKAPTKAWVDAARTQCRELLTIDHANALFSPKNYIKECVQDCILSKSYDFIESSKRTYLSDLYDYIHSAEAEPVFNGKSPAAQELHSSVVQTCNIAGLGPTQCLNKCTGNGLCTNNGCLCNPGFTGLFCDKVIPKAPPEDRSYTGEPAPYSEEEEEEPEPEIGTRVTKAFHEEESGGYGEEKI